MKSRITIFRYYSNIESSIQVTNPDKTQVEFTIPSGLTFDEAFDKLTTTANAYIAAFEETHPKHTIVVASENMAA